MDGAVTTSVTGARASRLESLRFVAARQTWLDAMPVAAAIVGLSRRRVRIIAANALFESIDAARGGKRGVLARLDCHDRILSVLDGAAECERLDWRDGGMIDGRFFSVAIARLETTCDDEPRAMLTLNDRTSEVQTEQSLRRQLVCDPLTGLANRVGFVEGLESRIADDGAESIAVVVVDLARFSRVNECMGTLGGDELIITVARRLAGLLRGYDLLGRTGANEFAIVVHLAEGPGDVLHIARRVQAALGQPFRLSDFEIKIDCAVGCALGSDGGDDAERLIRHAQIALKTSKTSSRVEVYQPAVLDAARRRFVIETELRRALEGDQLDLAFQPLMSLTTGRIAGFEALARWQHPDRGAISPTEFITVAEDSGLIVPLGRWALDRALAALAGWDKAAGRNLPLYMSVNMSPIQVTRDDVPGVVEGALRQHHLSGSRLTIELTESAIISDPDRTGRTLEALKACHARLAMDDFGTGFSNLASLQRLPIDMLKIDRSFVTDMHDDPDKAAIVRAILSLAQALGMTTTAEGVESAGVSKTLAALGCTTGQGYHYSEALGADAALAFALHSLG